MRIEKHNKTALLLGAHELVGRKCLLRLLQHEAYSKVVLLLEEPLNFQHSKLEVHTLNFEHLSRYKALFQVDDVYYCWGKQMKIRFMPKNYSPQKTYAYELAKLSLEQGAHQFMMLSSIGAASNNVLSYRREHWELENAISELPFWSVHLFRTGILLEDDKPSTGTRLVKNLSRRINHLAGGNLSKYAPVSAPSLAAFMIHQAQQLIEGIHIYSAEYINEAAGKLNEGLTKHHG